MQFLAFTQENLQQFNLMSPEDISENFQESYRQVVRNSVTTIKYGTKIHSLIDFILNSVGKFTKHNLQEEREDTTEA